MPRYDERDAFHKIRQTQALAELNPARRTLPSASVTDGGVIRIRSGGDVIVEPGGIVDVSAGRLALGDGSIYGSWLDSQLDSQSYDWSGSADVTGSDFDTLLRRTITRPAWATQTIVSLSMSGTASWGGKFRITCDGFANPVLNTTQFREGNDNNFTFSDSMQYGSTRASFDVTAEFSTVGISQTNRASTSIQALAIFIR